MESSVEMVLGFLWQDIGAFKERACLPEDTGKDCREIGGAWLAQQYGDGLIPEMARARSPGNGGVPRNLVLVANEAKRCTSPIRTPRVRPTDHGQPIPSVVSDRALTNIFSLIKDPRNLAPLPEESCLPLNPLGNWLEPQPATAGPKHSPEDYLRHWQEFEKDFNLIKKGNLHRSLDLSLHLLEKYLSTVPMVSETGEEAEDQGVSANLSLFDHAKTTAALAHSLCLFYREQYPSEWNQRALEEEISGLETWQEGALPPFLLVGGDISGVQRFIYTIASTGALKSVKGRSIFLEILTEHVVDYLLAELALFRCNVLFTGGGHFYLVAPNTKAAREKVETVQRAVNDYLLKDFNGQLQMFIEGEPFNKAELWRAGEIFSRLSGRLEEAKRRPWADRLDDLLGEPKPPDDSCLTENCEVCGREDQKLVLHKVGDTEQAFCSSCREQFLLGETLQTALRESGGTPVFFISTTRPPDGERALGIRTYGFERYYLAAKGPDKPPPNLVGIFHLNSWNLEDFSSIESRPLLSSTYHEEEFKDLEELALRGFGMGQVGVLRMDVDFLGKIFSTPFAQGEDLLARKASLSRQVSLFFKYHLDGILKADGSGYEKFRSNLPGGPLTPRKLSVVYAGGDDLFIIGHWLDALEAAVDIREAFYQFTANPSLTLSGGYVTAPVYHTLYRLASLSGGAEFQAKKVGGQEKNRLGLGGERVFTWGELKEQVFMVLNFLRGLLEMTPAGSKLTPVPRGVSTGFFFRLLQLCRDKRREGVLKLPALAWIFSRHKPQEERLFEPWQRLQNYVFSMDFEPPVMETALLWTIMMMRKGGE